MKTAVEWLQIKMATSSTEEMVENINVWFEEAKEMEKEYIVNAHYQGYRPSIGTTEISEQYYNETFKQQDNENSSRMVGE
jgi:hypothetical protein